MNEIEKPKKLFDMDDIDLAIIAICVVVIVGLAVAVFLIWKDKDIAPLTGIIGTATTGIAGLAKGSKGLAKLINGQRTNGQG